MDKNWLVKFDRHYKQAQAAGDFRGFSSTPFVCLTTASKEGVPSCRMVLLKQYDEKGLVMYTNMKSKKGKQISDNPQASLCFYWPYIKKEIIFHGDVEILSDAESDAYFESRPFQSKVGAHASKQSQIIKYPFNLIFRISFFMIKYLLKRKVDRPEYWKGFRVIPDEMIDKDI